MISKRVLLISLVCFLVIEAILFALILFIPSVTNINPFCYISIVMCFLFGGFLFLSHRSKFALLVVIALFFTVVSDTFLVLLNKYLCVTTQSLGMSSFLLVQVAYFFAIWILTKDKRELWANIITRSALFIVLEVVGIIILRSSFNYLTFISLLYFANLLTNIVFAFFHVKEKPFLAIGLLLFIGCDLFIGLQALCDMLGISSSSVFYQIVYYPFNFSWLFYLPSQVLLACSIFSFKSTKVESETFLRL